MVLAEIWVELIKEADYMNLIVLIEPCIIEDRTKLYSAHNFFYHIWYKESRGLLNRFSK